MPVDPAWSPALSVGHAVLDAQHERLLLLCSKLFTPAGSMTASDLVSLLNDLATLTYQHFDAEERILLESGYPQLEAHRAEHDELRGRLTDLLYEAIYGPLDYTNLPPLARDLVLNHVRDCDHAFKSFLTRESL